MQWLGGKHRSSYRRVAQLAAACAEAIALAAGVPAGHAYLDGLHGRYRDTCRSARSCGRPLPSPRCSDRGLTARSHLDEPQCDTGLPLGLVAARETE